MDEMHQTRMALAKRLINLRGERPRREISQSAVISLRTLEGLERGLESANPTLITLHSLAKAHGVPLRDLLDGSDTDKC